MTEPYVVPDTHTWMHGDLHVALALPGHTRGPVPLVVMLDGRSTFLTAVEYARTVSLITMGALPPMAIAGIWRDSTNIVEYMSTRFRDFTPYEWVLPDPFADDNAMVQHGTGAAAAFLDEIVHHVLPAVRSHVDISDVTLGGWSLSGLFAAWAWRERPDVFAHLIAISPSLWWHHARILDEDLPARSGARAFISAGECEEGDIARVWPQIFAVDPQRKAAGMVRNAVRFGELCEAAGIDTQTVVFPDEHHVTLMPASIARALQHIHAGP